MNKLSVKFVSIALTLIFIIATLPSVGSKNTILTGENTELKSFDKLVYIGDLYIEGTGDHSTSIVMATAKQNLKIGVDPLGSDVIIEAKYLLQCPGLFDYGYAELWVSGADEKSIDTDDYAEGYLYTKVYNCKWGDIIDWVLTVIYDDLLFPYPLIDFDGGGGICNKVINEKETSNNIFLQFLEKFIDQYQILKNIIYRTQKNNMTFKGTIICN